MNSIDDVVNMIATEASEANMEYEIEKRKYRNQPAEDERVERVKELTKLADVAAARVQNYAASLGKGFTFEQHKDIEYIIGKVLTDSALSLLPVQPAQTVDLSLLPYEIAEELPKIGGEFGKIAAMCKSHVAAFIEKLISERTVQPAQQDDGWVTFGRIKTDIESETETYERIPVQPATSTPTEPIREQVAQAITSIEEARLSHLHWAEHFEAHPEEERRYEATGEWDTAKTHREWIAKYDNVITLLDRAFLAPRYGSAAILVEALKKAHACATLRDDGTCVGCFVSEALERYATAAASTEAQDE